MKKKLFGVGGGGGGAFKKIYVEYIQMSKM